ncbi:MAG: hypothetical protein ACFFAO_21805 [Candidatus Hermodarchaeota archaeon]
MTNNKDINTKEQHCKELKEIKRKIMKIPYECQICSKKINILTGYICPLP